MKRRRVNRDCRGLQRGVTAHSYRSITADGFCDVAADICRDVSADICRDVSAHSNFYIFVNSCMQPTRRVDLKAFTREMDLLTEIIKDCDFASLERLQSIASICNRENNPVRSITIKKERESLCLWMRLTREAVRFDMLEVIAYLIR